MWKYEEWGQRPNGKGSQACITSSCLVSTIEASELIHLKKVCFHKTNLSKQQTSLLIRTSCSYSQITHSVPQEIRSIVSINEESNSSKFSNLDRHGYLYLTNINKFKQLLYLQFLFT